MGKDDIPKIWNGNILIHVWNHQPEILTGCFPVFSVVKASNASNWDFPQFVWSWLCAYPVRANLGVTPNMTGWWLTYPSEKYEFVSWDHYSQYMEKWKMFPNHQPDDVLEYHLLAPDRHQKFERKHVEDRNFDSWKIQEILTPRGYPGLGNIPQKGHHRPSGVAPPDRLGHP